MIWDEKKYKKFIFRDENGAEHYEFDMSDHPMTKEEEYKDFFNLQGDQLLDPCLKETLKPEVLEFRKKFESSEAGWVEILPMNENLIFMKGPEGAYDFIFKTENRDHSF